ncbi:hypothetical protein ACFVRD_46255 [Streptomyces sp. NPDC057908]|uniref:hypothetical protein n=1 Tax=Streptomyces sp. NPDC057908 TaxID=3346276 RepID=UPI0036EB99BB
MEFTAHAALEMPRGQDRLDHLPAGIGRLRFERRGRQPVVLGHRSRQVVEVLLPELVKG